MLRGRNHHMDWRFSTFILFLLAMLIGIPWATSETGICSSKFVLDVLKQETKDGALNCFEFWFNRYQTLLGAAVALGAAWYAGRWVKRQIEKTDQAMALTRSQIAASILPDLEKKARGIDSILAMLESMEEHASSISRKIDSVLRANPFNNFDHPGEQRGEPYYKNCIIDINRANKLNSSMLLILEKAKNTVNDTAVIIDLSRNVAIDAQQRVSSFEGYIRMQGRLIELLYDYFEQKDLARIQRGLQTISNSGMYQMVSRRENDLYRSEVRAALIQATKNIDRARARVVADAID